jgi:hypothetical protein
MLILAMGLAGLLNARAAIRAGDATSAQQTISFTKLIAPLLTQYCTQCHGGAKPKGKLALDIYREDAAALKDAAVWEKVARRLRDHEMPPADRPQPSAAEIHLITGWAGKLLSATDCIGKKDPGWVTLRRLNRAEYNNTVRDLLGVDFHPADDFPADDVGYGFDNVGDVLSLPPLLLEKYLAAAEEIIARALARPETRRRILICRPTEETQVQCARKILSNFARQAYRRPLVPAEVERLAGFVKLARSQGDSFEKGIELGLQAILVSPHFLFRVERDPRPGPEDVHPVNEYELATRLSYFLWSSMPDDELFRQAERQTLRKNLDAQVRRMLQDGKSRALVENFAGQWLQTRNLKTAAPDPGQFPNFDEALRSAMLTETEMFFEAVLREDRSVLEFLDAPFSFVNERLAKHYGIPGVQGDQFRRVSLAASQRGGILTQASILTITSNPTGTSPVKRGKWILENILGTPPRPPPPDAGRLNEEKAVVLSGSLRQRMEQHRTNPTCASCHERMDPLGFGLENFDGIGAWREYDGRFPIDPSGKLPAGQSFQGPTDLKGILMNKKDDFSRCLAEKMLTYALGRGVEHSDRCVVDQIARELARNDYKFSSLVHGVARSDPFQMRQGKRGPK